MLKKIIFSNALDKIQYLFDDHINRFIKFRDIRMDFYDGAALRLIQGDLLCSVNKQYNV